MKAQRQGATGCTNETSSNSALLSTGRSGRSRDDLARPGCLAKACDIYLKSQVGCGGDLHFTMTATWKAVKENDQKVIESHAGKG